MSSLYNKYKPRTLNEVVGQETICKMLKAICKRKDLPNAIVFSGIEGVGKTVLAHIFAKMINCLDEEEKPCGKCKNCKIMENEPEDIIETDGATNTSIENVRKIQEHARYYPLQLKYKVYIIDEVHMLSRSAFDALLDITHNPPSYVRFVFATTAPEKLPRTFLSRCILLPCRKISFELMFNHLKSICSSEKVNLNDKIITAIAKSSEGSLRKSLALLEPILLLEEDDEKAMLDYLKVLSTDKCLEILAKILDGKPKNAIEVWRQLSDTGYDEKEFFRKMSEIFVNLFLIKIGEKAEDEERLKRLIDKYSISFPLLINFWEVVIAQTEALYNGCSYLVETSIVMMSVLEEETDLGRKIKTAFNLKN